MKPFTIGALCGFLAGYLLWAFVKVDLNWTRDILTAAWTSGDRACFLYMMFLCSLVGGCLSYVMRGSKP